MFGRMNEWNAYKGIIPEKTTGDTVFLHISVFRITIFRIVSLCAAARNHAVFLCAAAQFGSTLFAEQDLPVRSVENVAASGDQLTEHFETIP